MSEAEDITSTEKDGTDSGGFGISGTVVVLFL
jgi:hypothetical protein